jgi:probable phosphoglycerate mutase
MPKSSDIVAYIDGAARGNPGPAAYGVVMESSGGARLAAFSEHFGKATNNVAEYRGLLAALEYALHSHHLRIHVRTDSQLLALQIRGVYKVKNPALKSLHAQAQHMIARLESFSIEHVPRQQNRDADQLANQALDAAERGQSHLGAAPPPLAPLPNRGGESAAGERPLGPHSAIPLPKRGGESGVGDALKGAAPLRAAATFHDGLLRPQAQLSLFEGEVVDLEIYRRQ